MRQLIDELPDAEVLIALEPEELGSKILFVLRNLNENMFTIHTILGVLNEHSLGGRAGYPVQRHHEIRQALFEAWSWLDSEGHIVWPDETNGPNGFRRLSRRAQGFTNAQMLADYTASVRLPRSMMHPRIADRVWLSFVRSEYDTAVFQALREVEIAVREACGFADNPIGVKLVRRAFGPGGPLRDQTAEEGEANALAEMFSGAIGSIKNPQSHRAVNLEEAAEAAEIAMFASLLLRIVDRRLAANASSP